MGGVQTSLTRGTASETDDPFMSVEATFTTARDRVREGVRTLILDGRLTPGTRLAQQHLARQFSVAQSVVRESLLELEAVGLVESVANHGMFVSRLDAEVLLQGYAVREMLEGLSARECCERVSRADLKELTATAERVYELGTSGKVKERGAADRALHRRIIEISGNGVVKRLTQSYGFLGMVVQASLPHEEALAGHMRIVEAIGAGDADGAERAARQHVAAAREAIRVQIAQGHFAPKWVVP